MVKDCQIGLELAECRGSVAWTDAGVATETSSVETLRSDAYSKLVPRLDTSWSPVSIGRFTEDWRYVGVRFLMFD